MVPSHREVLSNESANSGEVLSPHRGPASVVSFGESQAIDVVAPADVEEGLGVGGRVVGVAGDDGFPGFLGE